MGDHLTNDIMKVLVTNAQEKHAEFNRQPKATKNEMALGLALYFALGKYLKSIRDKAAER